MGPQTDQPWAVVALDHDIGQVAQSPDHHPEKCALGSSDQVAQEAQEHEQLMDQLGHAGFSDKTQKRIGSGLFGDAFLGQTAGDTASYRACAE